jgi:hypothetical protein
VFLYLTAIFGTILNKTQIPIFLQMNINNVATKGNSILLLIGKGFTIYRENKFENLM